MNAIAPPISSASARSTSASDTPSLSETFAPPRTATYGRSGSREEPAEHLDLPLQQPSGGRRPAGRAHQVGQGDDARVRAMRRAERVVHVRVGELGELSREADVVGLLSRIEAEVLEEDHVARLDVAADGLGPVADDLVERHHLDARAAPRAGRRRARGGGRRAASPSGRPRWDATTRAAPRSRSSRRVGTRRADPQVVGHAAALERDVEVDADEDPGAGDVAEVVEGPERH